MAGSKLPDNRPRLDSSQVAPIDEGVSVQLEEEPVEQEPPCWHGEAWSRDDGLILNLPLFKPLPLQFKRSLLREIRCYECQVYGALTWSDENFKICTLEKLEEDKLPPFRQNTIGMAYDKGDYICRGGDYDTKLVVVLRGKVEKLIGDSCNKGLCVVRTMIRGDCDGLTEFLGAGSEQRTCALRAAEDGTRVRLIEREAYQRVLNQRLPLPPEPEPVEDPDAPAELQQEEDPVPEMPDTPREPVKPVELPLRWPDEAAYFSSLSLDLIDALPHQASRDLLYWRVAGDTPLDYLKLPGMDFFVIDDSLGMKQSGPLPEGIEERYYLDGQIVLKRGVPGDCALMILRGQVEAEVPEGCAGNCVHAAAVLEKAAVDVEAEGSWIGTGRPEPPPRPPTPPPTPKPEELLEKAAPVLRGKKRRLKIEKPPTPEEPPPPPPPPEPRAVLGAGSIFGQMTLLGAPVILAGTVRAKGPCLVAVLHRSALLMALAGQPERELFIPSGIALRESITFLSRPSELGNRSTGNRPPTLGPATGPPPHSALVTTKGAAAGTISAWRASEGLFAGRAGADALELVLLNALRSSAVLWKLVDDAPDRLMEAVIGAFEARWLLPNEVVVKDEEPDADFLFVVVHGTFNVMLEGLQIDAVGQGAVLGEAQLLALNDWTRTVVVDPKHEGEALVQVLRRDKLLEVLAGHPVPKGRLREVEEELKETKEADWRILQRVPTFLSIASKPFLERLHKDADILFFCPGDHIAVANHEAASLVVILAGTCRSEQPLTLFCLELKRGDWCFQNNILGNDKGRSHDVVAVTHTMVLILHRHVLLNAVTDFPATRKVILENETWRSTATRLGTLRLFEGVPAPVLSQLESESSPRYFRAGSQILAPGDFIPDDSVYLILRGEAVVYILGIEVRSLKAGDTIGVLRYLDLPMLAGQSEIVARTACDVFRIPRGPMFEALEKDEYEDALAAFVTARRTLSGGPILDAYGFATGGGGTLATDCIERSDVFMVCNTAFVAQIPRLVEDEAFWPGETLCEQGEDGDRMFFIQAGQVRIKVLGMDDEIINAGGTVGDMACLGLVPQHTSTAVAETHVWARVLHRSLLERALKSFPGEHRRLTGARDRGNVGVFDD